MTEKMSLKAIGQVHAGKSGYSIQLEKEYIPALQGLKDFSHIHILWWANLLDDEKYRNTMTVDKPYRRAPEKLGIFATRSPVRPNPVCVSICPVKSVDLEKGIVELYYTDAEEGTPVLDIKPYVPASDRVKEFYSPEWCSHWPQYFEVFGEFDWASEFNFKQSF